MGKGLDGRADQYALAATAYHLLTGKPVYSDSNPVAVISQHLTEQPPAPSTIRAELAPFDAAFARALAKKPEDRFTAARISHLRSRQPPGRALRVTLPRRQLRKRQPAGAAAVAAEGSRRSPKLAILAVVAVLGLSAGGALLWQPWIKQDQAHNSPPAPPTTTASASPTTTTTTPAMSSTSPPSPAPPQTRDDISVAHLPPAGALGSACPPPGGAIGTGPDAPSITAPEWSTPTATNGP